MNIFALDKDPIKAAQSLHDIHCSKMILESAEMLSYVAARYGHPAIYKTTGSHKNHPATIWAGNRRKNWEWLIEHALTMETEKIYRTGKGHKSAEVIRFYLENNYGPPEDGLDKELFVLCMPDKYKGPKKVQAYRDYYVHEKQVFKNGGRPKWTKREPPDWWTYFEI